MNSYKASCALGRAPRAAEMKSEKLSLMSRQLPEPASTGRIRLAATIGSGRSRASTDNRLRVRINAREGGTTLT